MFTSATMSFLCMFLQLFFCLKVANGDNRVKVLNGSVTWTEAESKCPELGPGYRVPVIEDQSDLPALEQALTSFGAAEAWLSLRRERFLTWTWLDGGQIGDEFSRQNWKPFMICGNYHMRDRVMEVDNCTVDRYGYICQGNMTCASYPVNPVDCLTVQDRVFMYGCYAASWYDARHKCRKLGMDLAMMSSDEDRKLVSSKWHDQDKKHCTQLWVGLRKDDWLQEGRLLPTSVLPRWAPGQPRHTGNCSIITTQGASGASWRTADCNLKKAALCFRKNDKLVAVTPQSRYINVTITIPTPETVPSPTATTNALTIIIVVIVCVAVLILVVAGICLFKGFRQRKRKMTNPYLSLATNWNQASPDVARDDAVDATPLMLNNKNGEESHWFTCVLVARQHKLASGRSVHEEITLEIFAFQRQGNSVASTQIEEAMKDKPGVMLRKDLHVNMPEEPDDQNECTLVTELTLDDSEMQIKGSNIKEVGLDQLFSHGGAYFGLPIAQFIIERTKKKTVRPFRIYIKFSWKKSEVIRMSVEYTDVVQCNKVNEVQKFRVKHSLGFNQSRAGSRHGSISWSGSNKEYRVSTAQRQGSFSCSGSNTEKHDSTSEKDTVDSGNTVAHTTVVARFQQSAVSQGMINDEMEESVPPESRRQMELSEKGKVLHKPNLTPAGLSNLENKHLASDGAGRDKNKTEEFTNRSVKEFSSTKLAATNETEEPRVNEHNSKISKDTVLEANQEPKADNQSPSSDSKETDETAHHETTVDSTDQISEPKELDQEKKESHASENGTRMSEDLSESPGDHTETKRKAEEGTPGAARDDTDVKNKQKDTSEKVHESADSYGISINSPEYGFSTPV